MYLPIAIEPTHLWSIDGAVGLLAACSFCVIFSYLEFDKWRIAKRVQVSKAFGNLVSEIILCEKEEELKATLQTDEAKALLEKYAQRLMARKILCEDLVRTHKSLSGSAAQNVQWLFTQLGLQNDVFHRFQSSKWHIKANAIQQLAEMKQKQYLTKIYKVINHPNYHVRMTAQLAIVKLTGFTGLRFLNVSRYPITPWQQLSLLQELSTDAVIDPERLRSWLHSENETVVEFTMKLMRKYQCFEFQDEIIAGLQSPHSWVRRQAHIIMQESPELSLNQAV